MGDGNDHVFDLDEVLVFHVDTAKREFGPPRNGELLFHVGQFCLDDLANARTRPQDIQQVGDLVGQALGLVADLVAAKAGQAVQAQVEDGAGLLIRQVDRVAAGPARAPVCDEFEQRPHVHDRPGLGEQLFAGRCRVWRVADDADHFVDIGHGKGEADQYVGPVARLVEIELGAADNHFLAEADERLEHGAEVEKLGAPTVQCQHIDAE